MSPNSWITIAKLGIFMDITKNLKKNRKKNTEKFCRFEKRPYICSPKVKETSFTHMRMW